MQVKGAAIHGHTGCAVHPARGQAVTSQHGDRGTIVGALGCTPILHSSLAAMGPWVISGMLLPREAEAILFTF